MLPQHDPAAPWALMWSDFLHWPWTEVKYRFWEPGDPALWGEMNGDFDSSISPDPEQREAIDRALSIFDAWFDIDFVNVTGTADDADIVFGYGDLGGIWAGLTYYDGWYDVQVVLDTYYAGDPVEGSFDFFVLLHEIGHALGLRHPWDEDPELDADHDNLLFTVMTYTYDPAYALGDVWPETPMLYDIWALAWLYGLHPTGWNSGGGWWGFFDWTPSVNPGNDRYSFDPDSLQFMTILDTGGYDTIDMSAAWRPVEIDLRPGAYSSLDPASGWHIAIFDPRWVQDPVFFPDFPGADSFIEAAIGGNGDDTIIGNHVDNRLWGRDGWDDIYGGDGADRIYGGGGVDWIEGEAGDDILYGGDDSDDIYGGSGNDWIIGDGGNDWMFGGDGNDKALGGTGNDTIFGNEGDDRLKGQEGDDTIWGDAGTDLLLGSAGNDALYGGDDNDYIYGEDGDDVANGDAGNDRLKGNDGADQLAGGEGDDHLFGGEGNDTLFGGDGVDWLIGDAGDDTAYGNAGDDRALGGTGNDTIFGNEGDDRLKGQQGDDVLDGGSGIDVLLGGPGNDVMAGGPDKDFLFGEDDNDSLSGGGGNDRMRGGDGDDWLEGGEGYDLLDGGAGTDTAVYYGTREDYLISWVSEGVWRVRDIEPDGPDPYEHKDILVDVELIWFAGDNSWLDLTTIPAGSIV